MSASLDELVAINDEMAALVRAGVPLGAGLQAAADDLPGRLGRSLKELGNRLQSGQSLEQAFAQSKDPFPEVYRAVVLAGVKSGRLAVALESLAASARQLGELRRVITLAIAYPLMLILIACGTFAFIARKILPSFHHLGMLDDSFGYRVLQALGVTTKQWMPLVDLLVVAVAIFVWYWAGRSGRLDLRTADRFWNIIPSPGRIIATSRVAAMSETLGLLVEHEVPLPDAVRLACDATGDRRVAQAGNNLANHLAQGGSASADLPTNAALPPRVLGLLIGQRDPRTLSNTLKSLALTYHRRALRDAEWLRYFLPPLLTLGIGGTLTLLYALSMFIPFTETMVKFAQPNLH